MVGSDGPHTVAWRKHVRAVENGRPFKVGHSLAAARILDRPRLHIFLCALAFLICQPIGAAGQISRFGTTAGPEPMGHAIDPDFGSQREFFRLDARRGLSDSPTAYSAA
jgi:hypothetical protein